MTSEKCPRVLINLEAVGNLGRKPDDVLLLGQCDAMIEELSKELGWHKELLELWDATQISVTEPKAVESAKDEVEELAQQLVTKVNLGEVPKKAPDPDTDLTDPSKPSIRSGDKVGPKPEKETSKETPEATGPSEPRPSGRDDDKDESKKGEPNYSTSVVSQEQEQVNIDVAEGKL